MRGAGARVVVVGAGVLGGWTALWLLRSGARVTLVDAWGAGNARSSSGGPTRVFRHGYDRPRHVALALRAGALWDEHGERWGSTLLERTGVLWLVGEDDAFERAALAHMEAAGVPHRVLDVDDVARRWPQVGLDGVRWALVEEGAGYLHARRACEAVRDAVRDGGGTLRRARVAPTAVVGGRLASIRTDDGDALAADAFVFACGPWLGGLFPDVLGDRLRVTRQEVFAFGPPAGDARFVSPGLPVWADHGERFWYGVPGDGTGGFKIADDTRGAPFDPTGGERRPSDAGLAAARAHLALRFPALRDAPLVDARVCQYADTPDGDFVVDRHPAAANAWLVGGGSGHAFKHGPALGRDVAAAVLGESDPDPAFALARFDARP